MMIDYLSNIMLNYLIKSSVIENTDQNREVYKYGAEITISSLLNIILIVLIGIISSETIASIIFLFVFISMRNLTGGFHADTYFKCNLILCMNFISVVILYKITTMNIQTLHIFVVMITILIPILVFSPVDNPNKCITSERRGRLKILAVILGTIYGTAAVVLYVLNYKIGIMILYTLLSVSIAVIAAKIQERG